MHNSSETGGTSKEVLSFEFCVLSYPKTSNFGPQTVAFPASLNLSNPPLTPIPEPRTQNFFTPAMLRPLPFI